MLTTQLTSSTAEHIIAYRDEQLRDSYRRAALSEALVAGRETNRRQHAEEAARLLAQRAAVAEETALQAIAAIDEVEAEREELLKQLDDAYEQVRTATITLADSRTETAATNSRLVRKVHELEKDAATTEITAAHRTMREARALRNALWYWRAFKRRALARRVCRRRNLGAGFAVIARPHHNKWLHEYATKARALFRITWRQRGFYTWRARFESNEKKVTDRKRGIWAFRRTWIGRALRKWMVLKLAATRARGQKRACISRFRKDGLHIALTNLARFAQRRAAIRIKCERVLRRIFKKNLTRGWITWRGVWEKRVIAKQQLQVAVSQWKFPQLSKAFGALSHVSEVVVHLRRPVAEIHDRRRRSALAKFFSIFSGILRQHALLRRGAFAFRRGRGLPGWLQWKSYLELRNQCRQRLLFALRVFRNHGLARALRAWLSTWAAQKVACSSMHKSLDHHKITVRRRTFVHWRGHLRRERAARESMGKCLGHFLYRALSRGWGAWHEMAVMRAEFMRKLRKAWSFLWDYHGACAFATWSAWASSLRHLHCTARKLMGQRIFAHWRARFLEFADERVWFRRHKITFRRRTFVHWRGYLRRERAARESMGKCLGHFLYRALSRGWGAWHEMAVMRAEFMCKLRKAWSFLWDYHGACAFATWSAWASDLSASKRFIADALNAFDPAVRQLRAAFGQYTQRCQDFVVLRYLSRKLQGAQKLRALNSLRSVLQSTLKQKTALRKGLSAFRNRWFVAWIRFTLEVPAKKREQKSRLAHAIRTYRTRALRRSWTRFILLWRIYQLLRLGKQETRTKQIRRGIVRWFSAASGRVRWARIKTSALRIMHATRRGRAIQRALVVWSQSSRYELMLKYCYVLLTPIRRLLGRWSELTQSQKEFALQRSQKLEGRALLRLRKQALYKGFLTWYELWLKFTNARRQAAGVVRALQDGGLRKGWFTWRAFYEETIELKGKLASFSNPGLKTALNSWTEMVERLLEAKRTLKMVGNQFRTGGRMVAAFEALHENAALFQKKRGVLASILDSRARSALNCWRNNSCSKRNQSIGFLLAAREARGRALLIGLKKWHAVLVRDRVDELKTVRNTLHVKPAFDKLVEWFAAARALSSLGLAGSGPMRTRKAFRRWLIRCNPEADSTRIDLFVRRLYRRTEARVSDRGHLLLKQLRHTDLRSIAFLWRRYVCTELPQPSTAWVHWKARGMQHTVAMRTVTARNTRHLAEGFEALRESAFARRLHQHDQRRISQQQACTTQLRKDLDEATTRLRKELKAAEATARLLRTALENAEHERDQALGALEEQRKAAIETLEAERAATLAVLTPRRQPETPPKPVTPKSYHRWSTAAARAHAKDPAKFDLVIAKQFHAATRVKPLERFAENQARFNAELMNRMIVVDGREASAAAPSPAERSYGEVIQHALRNQRSSPSRLRASSPQADRESAGKTPAPLVRIAASPELAMRPTQEVFSRSRWPPASRTEGAPATSLD